MKEIFGGENSWLGGNEDDDLPLVVGAAAEEPASVVMVLVCGECDCRYALPEEIEDARLLEMCPRCASLFRSGGAEEAA